MVFPSCSSIIRDDFDSWFIIMVVVIGSAGQASREPRARKKICTGGEVKVCIMNTTVTNGRKGSDVQPGRRQSTFYFLLQFSMLS